MRPTRSAVLLAAATLLATPVLAQASPPAASWSSASGVTDAVAPSMQPWLAAHLDEVAPETVLRVMVRGTDVDAAAAAAQAAGLAVQQRWPLADIVVGVGPASAVPALLEQDGVVHVEGDSPIDWHLETAHEATQSDLAAADPVLGAFDGTGVTIAVIDSGIDGTHPFFQQDGATKVVQNRKNVCGIDLRIDPLLSEACFASVPDTDTISVGGHGTHVAGIAAGVEVTTSAGDLRGAATGATLVGLSVGAAVGLLDAAAAQNWVLEHHQNPCRSAAAQTESEVDPECPPIRVTNHSYGPAANTEEGNSFNEASAAAVLQRALVEEGVVAVWAAGNDGGDGSLAFTNPDGMDPTGGVIMVASYNDGGTGTRDGALSDFSSRGDRDDPTTWPDLSAPGDLITSSCRIYLPICATGLDLVDGGNYNTISGTSMAAPYVAGVVAQLFQADPALTPAAVEDVLEQTAYAFGDGYAESGSSFDKGHGLVDVSAALAAVTGQDAPVAQPAACGVDAAFTDASGDATRVIIDTPLPSDSSLDIVGSRLATDAETGAVTFTIAVEDLTAPTAYGQYFDYNATIAGKGYFLSAQRTVAGEETFALGDFSGAQGARANLAALTGSFDDEADEVRITIAPGTGGLALAEGESISGLSVVSRRQFDAVAVSFIPDADDAAGPCAYSVGAEHADTTEPTDPGDEQPPCEPKGKNGKGRNCDKGKP